MNGFTPEEMSRGGDAQFVGNVIFPLDKKAAWPSKSSSASLQFNDKIQRARHLYICDYHKNLIQSVRNRRKRKGSDDDGGDSPVQDIDTPEVDLYQLQVNTLRRYKRHFKLSTRPGLNKAQLVEIVGCHFRSIPVNEKDTLTYFIYSVKNDKNKSDLKVDSGVH
ncbi:histone deacetylase complex subunit [Lynx pardinus]|uniref:Histone deacetylase complex subunit n=1 Tax=Lynx pardinus TaxID=191816 RepID=A0A485NK30_LYNPA|nr:histone deacetylase complex subunit [Lynx pardinus]